MSNTYECPKCNSTSVYPGALSSSGNGCEVNSIPCLFIEPSKFKLTLIDSNYMEVDKRWYVCGNCGLVWSNYNVSKLNKKIEKWLIGTKIIATQPIICCICESEALLWKMQARGRAPYEMWFIFEKIKIKLTLNLRPEFDITQSATVCSNCEMIITTSEVIDVKNKIDKFSPKECSKSCT